jgi:iron complex transport system ATP-binding protein
MKSKIVSVKKADVVLDGKIILKNINWEAFEGENWFILGANGAGKTTLVRLLLGHIWPIFGAEIEILGNVFGLSNLTEIRKKIAWVSPFLQQWTSKSWTVGEVVLSGIDGTIGLYTNHPPEDIERADSIMRSLDLYGKKENSYGKVSTGEQVKSLIARALIGRPALMILDEPFVHLDMKSREYLLESIENLAVSQDAPPIFFITQRIEDISPVFTKGLILKNGGILASGPRDKVITEDILKKTFGLEIKIHRGANGRFWPVIS